MSSPKDSSVGKNIHLQHRRPQFDSWVRKICWRRDRLPSPVFLGFPCGSAGKESTCNAGDLGSIPGLGRSPGEGRGYPLQYSGLENSMDRGPGRLQFMGLQSWTRLSNFTFYTFTLLTIILEWAAIPFSRGIFPTQGLNPGLPHCRQILYQLSHKGSP